MAKTIKVPIEISARHAHLSQKDIDSLFGKGYRLTRFKTLSQPHEFASNEFVTIRTRRGDLRLRILGPARDSSQVELSQTDAVKLGLKPPARMSGNLANTPGALLVGPKGQKRLKEGVILAWRHIHSSPKQAAKFGLLHNTFVSVKIKGERSLIFENVRIKISPEFDWHMHIDTDEANAAGVTGAGVEGQVLT